MTVSTIAPPRTYAEWVLVLDMLKNKTDDEDVLQAMQNGSVEWQTGVAERFSKKLIDTVNHRMNSATDKFQKEMARSHGQERAIVQALLSLRRELGFLSKVLDLPALPESDRRQYCQLVADHADKIQSSLVDSAKTDRSGKLASIVRNNRVNAF